MKGLSILIFSSLLILLVSCSKSSDNRIIQWKGNALSDYYGLIGDPKGSGQPVPIKFDSIAQAAGYGSADSVRLAFFEHFMGDKFQPDLYRYQSMQFYDDYLTYNYASSTDGTVDKIVSTYQFKNDSLFINQKTKNGLTPLYVAMGTKDLLYRNVSFAKFSYINNLGQRRDTVINDENSVYTLDQIWRWSRFGADRPFLKSDTIIISSVKYIFQQ